MLNRASLNVQVRVKTMNAHGMIIILFVNVQVIGFLLGCAMFYRRKSKSAEPCDCAAMWRTAE